METNNLSASAEAITQTEKQHERSAAYPSITISEAISVTIPVYQNFKTTSIVKRGDILAITKRNATVNRDVAAAVQYGILERAGKESYKVTKLFVQLYQPIDQREKKQALVTAFSNPKLYKELIEKYDNHSVPNELKIVLFRQHNITEKASEGAAQIFVQNAKEIGLIDNNGILRINSDAPIPQEPNVVESKTEEVIELTTNTPISKIEPAALVEINQEERQVIPLTEKKKAILFYPSNYTVKDIAAIRKQLDVLEFLITS